MGDEGGAVSAVGSEVIAAACVCPRRAAIGAVEDDRTRNPNASWKFTLKWHSGYLRRWIKSKRRDLSHTAGEARRRGVGMGTFG